MRIRQGSHRLRLDGHLVTGLCITFITNDQSLERGSFFQVLAFGFWILHLQLLPLTMVCQMEWIRFCIKRRHLPLFIGANGTSGESLLLIWILIQLRDCYPA